MKRTVRLSLGMSFIMLALVLLAPHLASPKLVLRFLPEDIYEAGKDHPVPSLPKRLLCHLLLLMAAAYMCSGRVKRATLGSARKGQYGSGKKGQSEEKATTTVHTPYIMMSANASTI